MPTFDRQAIALLTNGDANGTGVVVQPGSYSFAVDGTFNAGTVKLQIRSPDGSNWIDIGGDATLSAEGVCLVELPAGEVRAAITGSPSALYATLSPIQA
jgi:hypothetical protein